MAKPTPLADAVSARFASPMTPLAQLIAANPSSRGTTWGDALNQGFGLPGAIQNYLSRLNRMQDEAQVYLDTAADPNVEGIQRAGNLLGGLGLKIANPALALMPSSAELRERGRQAGASPEVQALGGALGDAVNIPEPASVATLLGGLGKAALTAKAAATAVPIVGKSMAVAPLGKGLGSLLADATPAEQAALKARLEAEAGQSYNAPMRLKLDDIDHGESAMPGGSLDQPEAWDLVRQYANMPTKAPPIEVYRDGNRWVVYDGSHRLEAAKLRGDTHIDAIDTSAGQTGGAASGVSREEALNNLTGNGKSRLNKSQRAQQKIKNNAAGRSESVTNEDGSMYVFKHDMGDGTFDYVARNLETGAEVLVGRSAGDKLPDGLRQQVKNGKAFVFDVVKPEMKKEYTLPTSEAQTPSSPTDGEDWLSQLFKGGS